MPNPRKPSHLKLVEGNRGKRPPNKKEPKPPPPLSLVPPKHLSAREQAAWRKFAPTLKKMGVLTEVDVLAALERVCAVYVEILELQEDIRKYGRTQDVETKAGGVFERQRPQVAMLQDADRRLRGWMAEFGMTPSSRTRVQRVGSEEDEDPAEQFFK